MKIEEETNDHFTRARVLHSKELKRVGSEILEARKEALRLVQDERNAILELYADQDNDDQDNDDQDNAEERARSVGTLRLDQDEAKLLPERNPAAASIFREKFNERKQAILACYRKIYDVLLRIMVTTTLAAFRVEKERRLQIRRLGFNMTGKPPEAIPTGVIPFCVVVGFIVIFLPTVLFWLTAGWLYKSLPGLVEGSGLGALVAPPSPEEIPRGLPQVGETLSWALTGALMHTLAICAAFIMVRSGAEDVLEFRMRERTILERWDEMMTGFIGGFFINVILLVVLAIAAGRPEEIPRYAPWALLPSVTGAFLALHLVSPEKTRVQAWLLALGQGAVTAMMTVILILYMSASAIDNLLVFGIYATVTAGLTGTAFGLIFPLVVGVGVGGEDQEEAATDHAVGEGVAARDTLLSPG